MEGLERRGTEEGRKAGVDRRDWVGRGEEQGGEEEERLEKKERYMACREGGGIGSVSEGGEIEGQSQSCGYDQSDN